MVLEWTPGDMWVYSYGPYRIQYVLVGDQEEYLSNAESSIMFGFISSPGADLHYYPSYYSLYPRTSILDAEFLLLAKPNVEFYSPDELEDGSIVPPLVVGQEYVGYSGDSSSKTKVKGRQTIQTRFGEKICYVIERVDRQSSDENVIPDKTTYWYSEEVRSHLRISDSVSTLELVDYAHLKKAEAHDIVGNVLAEMADSANPSLRLRAIVLLNELRRLNVSLQGELPIERQPNSVLNRLTNDPDPYVKEKAASMANR